MSNMSWWTALIAAALSAVACSAPEFDLAPTSGGGAAGTDAPNSDGTSGGAADGGAAGGLAEVCKASNCQDARCVNIPPITQPWVGPLVVSSVGATACPGMFPTVVATVGDLDEPAGMCPVCKCVPGAGVTCPVPDLLLYSDATCSAPPIFTKTLPATGCATLSFSGSGPAGFGFAKPKPKGTCIPEDDGASPVIPPSAVVSERLLCQGVAGAGVSTCAVNDGRPLCVASPLLDACPSGYPAKQSLAEGPVKDGRSCSPCACGALQGSCDGTVIRRYVSTACSGASASVSDQQQGCAPTNTTLLTQFFGLVAAPKPNVSCAPTGGEVVGVPAPARSWTVCCTH